MEDGLSLWGILEAAKGKGISTTSVMGVISSQLFDQSTTLVTTFGKDPNCKKWYADTIKALQDTAKGGDACEKISKGHEPGSAANTPLAKCIVALNGATGKINSGVALGDFAVKIGQECVKMREDLRKKKNKRKGCRPPR